MAWQKKTKKQILHSAFRNGLVLTRSGRAESQCTIVMAGERDVSHMFRGDLQVFSLPFGLGEAHANHLARTVGGKRQTTPLHHFRKKDI